MKSTWFILIVVFWVFSCQNNEFTSSEGVYNLIESHVKKFPLDQSTSYIFHYLNVLQGDSGEETLVTLNHTKPSILFYDIKSEGLDKEIILQKTGPDGVGNPRGLYLESMDSIYVISSYEYRVRLINSEAKVLKTYDILNGEKYNESTGLIDPYTTSLPVKINGELYFSVVPDRNPFKPSFFEGYINQKFDINTGQFSYFNSYPNEFKNHIWGAAVMDYSFVPDKDHSSLVYSFTISDSLLIYNLVNNQKLRVNARSRFKQKELEPMKPSVTLSDMTERERYNLDATHYDGIVYDRFNEVYYRFVQHSHPYKDSNGEINQYHEKPISVIILDKDYNILGETMLAKNKFLFYIYFVSSEGLCIANANPENPNLEEDFAVFTCFKLEKKS